MEGKTFSVEHAASILGCSGQTVRNLLAKGWLAAPEGRPKERGGVRVSEKSLFKFMIYDRVSELPERTLRDLKNGRWNFRRFISKTAEANRFSIDEGASATEQQPSPYPLPQKERENNSNERKRCLHHEFAEQHQFSFGWRARQLAPGDPALQDDLVQEMSLAVLEYDKPANFEFLFELAGNRAIDYLRYEAARGRWSLSEARQGSDDSAEKLGRLKMFIDTLMRRGVPAEWIEEVLGERLDVA